MNYVQFVDGTTVNKDVLEAYGLGAALLDGKIKGLTDRANSLDNDIGCLESESTAKRLEVKRIEEQVIQLTADYNLLVHHRQQ